MSTAFQGVLSKVVYYIPTLYLRLAYFLSLNHIWGMDGTLLWSHASDVSRLTTHYFEEGTVVEIISKTETLDD